MTEIVLGSSSPYRRQLLEQLQIPFQCSSPDIDESRLNGENAMQLVLRLAQEKAKKVAETFPQSIIIASDQVASLGDEIITKPGNFANAKQQLTQASGQQLDFYTSLCVYNAQTQQMQLDSVVTTVVFRHLTEQQIEGYLEKERPFNCAGSFKMESLGIALFTEIRTEDSSALIGLPLIKLTQMLMNQGLDVLS